MNWAKKITDGFKRGLRRWLGVNTANSHSVTIDQVLDFELSAIRNRIWYRGDGNEIEQLYQQLHDYADKYKFWASRSTPGMEIRKIHTGLPGLIVRILLGVILPDMHDLEFKDSKQADIWKEADKENKFKKILKKALSETLVIGDGAFKISIDTDISQYPILEWFSGERVEFVRRRDRIQEIVFKTAYAKEYHKYVLCERYGYGYVTYELCEGDKPVDLKTLKETENLVDVEYADKNLILAVPLMIYDSVKWESRGGSIFDRKLDNFDALDEIWSQWMDAIRAGRAKDYVPESYIPRDPETGELRKPNPFDTRYIVGDNNMAEGAKNTITSVQPDIPHESYRESYITALDLCLQGILSPSTLGIDTKKLDNAEAQREKEKTTLYTRDTIVEVLQEVWPQVVAAFLNAYYILQKQGAKEIDVTVPFGEYANPSFESQVETVGKGKSQGILSIEAAVDELYGDSKDEEWKAEEVARLKNEQGIATVVEPGVNLEGVSIDEGEGSKANIPNEPSEVPGVAENSS